MISRLFNLVSEREVLAKVGHYLRELPGTIPYSFGLQPANIYVFTEDHVTVTLLVRWVINTMVLFCTWLRKSYRLCMSLFFCDSRASLMALTKKLFCSMFDCLVWARGSYDRPASDLRRALGTLTTVYLPPNKHYMWQPF